MTELLCNRDLVFVETCVFNLTAIKAGKPPQLVNANLGIVEKELAKSLIKRFKFRKI
jgi:hypothetical protein